MSQVVTITAENFRSVVVDSATPVWSISGPNGAVRARNLPP